MSLLIRLIIYGYLLSEISRTNGTALAVLLFLIYIVIECQSFEIRKIKQQLRDRIKLSSESLTTGKGEKDGSSCSEER